MRQTWESNKPLTREELIEEERKEWEEKVLKHPDFGKVPDYSKAQAQFNKMAEFHREENKKK